MTAEEIVRKLTKAQRRAIVALDHVGFTDWKKVYRQRGQRIWAHANNLTEPQRLGPVTMWCNIRLTAFGLEVRRLLENTHDRS